MQSGGYVIGQLNVLRFIDIVACINSTFFLSFSSLSVVISPFSFLILVAFVLSAFIVINSQPCNDFIEFAGFISFFFYNELLPLLMLSSVCLLSNLIRGFFCL